MGPFWGGGKMSMGQLQWVQILCEKHQILKINMIIVYILPSCQLPWEPFLKANTVQRSVETGHKLKANTVQQPVETGRKLKANTVQQSTETGR